MLSVSGLPYRCSGVVTWDEGHEKKIVQLAVARNTRIRRILVTEFRLSASVDGGRLFALFV